MINDVFSLKLFFHEVLELGIRDLRETRSNMGFACKQLLDDMCIRQQPFLDRIMNDYSEDSHEYRLNQAGLKMYWKVVKLDSGDRKFVCSIGGDQAKNYPWFVPAFNMLLRKHNCCKITFRNNMRWKNID